MKRKHKKKINSTNWSLTYSSLLLLKLVSELVLPTGVEPKTLDALPMSLTGDLWELRLLTRFMGQISYIPARI